MSGQIWFVQSNAKIGQKMSDDWPSLNMGGNPKFFIVVFCVDEIKENSTRASVLYGNTVHGW